MQRTSRVLGGWGERKAGSWGREERLGREKDRRRGGRGAFQVVESEGPIIPLRNVPSPPSKVGALNLT